MVVEKDYYSESVGSMDVDSILKWKTSVSPLFYCVFNESVTNGCFQGSLDLTRVEEYITFKISSVSQDLILREDLLRGYKEGFFVLSIKEGSGWAVVAGEEVSIKAGDILVFHSQFDFRLLTTDFVIEMIFSPVSKLRTIASYLRMKRYFYFESGSFYSDVLYDMVALGGDRDSGVFSYDFFVNTLENSVISSSDNIISNDFYIVDRIYECVKSSFKDCDVTTKYLSECLGLRESKIVKIMKDFGGISSYLSKIRSEFVAAMIADKRYDYTMFRYAVEAGFKSEATFRRAFKKRFGFMPNEFFKVGGERAFFIGFPEYYSWFHDETK